MFLPGQRFRADRYRSNNDDYLIHIVNLEMDTVSIIRLGVYDNFVGDPRIVRSPTRGGLDNLRNQLENQDPSYTQIRGLSSVPRTRWT